MLRFLVLVGLIVATGYLVAGGGGANPLEIVDEGQAIVVATPNLRARFQRGAPFEETYMLFGGVAADEQGHFVTALYAGLARRHVAFISQRHPDFHLCASPGADSAKALTEQFNLIATSGEARQTLHEALDLHAQRIGRGAERTCVHLAGRRLYFVQAETTHAEFPLPREAEQSYRRTDYYLVDRADLVDCETIVRSL